MRKSGAMAGMEVQASFDSQNPNRPPLYMPTKREPGMSRDGSMTFGKAQAVPPRPKASGNNEYQFKTELFSYKPSAAEQPYFARQNSRGDSGSRQGTNVTNIGSGFGGTGFSSGQGSGF